MRYYHAIVAAAVAALLSHPAVASGRHHHHYRAPAPQYRASNFAVGLGRGLAHMITHRREAARPRAVARYAGAAHHRRLVLSLPPEPGHLDLVTVPTAAGIKITVAASFASAMQGFVADLVARGYTPRSIACYSPTGHVPHSLHHIGEACDFDQTARNRPAGPMYSVSALAAAHGLRDGCSFHDCGHIDSGRRQ